MKYIHVLKQGGSGKKVKDYVWYLSRRITSPKYILYQLNKEMSLGSLHVFFHLHQCHF